MTWEPGEVAFHGQDFITFTNQPSAWNIIPSFHYLEGFGRINKEKWPGPNVRGICTIVGKVKYTLSPARQLPSGLATHRHVR